MEKFIGELKGKDWTSDNFLKDPKRVVRPDDKFFFFPPTKVDNPSMVLRRSLVLLINCKL